jgi:uncharacterized protein YlxW (UPF0749 family)
LVAVLAGLLIGTNASLFAAEELGPGGLAGLVADQVSQVEALEATVAELTEQVEQMSAAEIIPAPAASTSPLDLVTGRTGVVGPGVTVTLSDAPYPREPDGDLAPDAYIVHQADLEAVLNTLWAAGAEAVAIQGQRLTSVAGVRCVGNVLLLAGRTYSPPYVIDAIGDPDRLLERLQTSPLTEPYRQWAEKIGLVWSVKSRPDLNIPAYPGGSITLRYIVEPDADQQEGAP